MMPLALAALIVAGTVILVGFTFIVNASEPSIPAVRLWPYLVVGLGISAVLVALG